MSLSKKRKIDAECRVFQDKWTECYFFTNVNGKAVCLVCHQQVSDLPYYRPSSSFLKLFLLSFKNLLSFSYFYQQSLAWSYDRLSSHLL